MARSPTRKNRRANARQLAGQIAKAQTRRALQPPESPIMASAPLKTVDPKTKEQRNGPRQAPA